MRWSREEEEVLREVYAGTSNEEIALRLGRSMHSVEMKAKRLGLRKEASSSHLGQAVGARFSLISREEALRRDKVELLRYCWSLTDMLQEEVNRPDLDEGQRHKMMNSLANMINITSSIMRYTPEEVFEVEPDLSVRFTQVRAQKSPVRPRRFRVGFRRTVVCP